MTELGLKYQIVICEDSVLTWYFLRLSFSSLKEFSQAWIWRSTWCSWVTRAYKNRITAIKKVMTTTNAKSQATGISFIFTGNKSKTWPVPICTPERREALWRENNPRLRTRHIGPWYGWDLGSLIQCPEEYEGGGGGRGTPMWRDRGCLPSG